MRTLMLIVAATLAGCQGVVGPFQRSSQPPVRVDNPALSIPEQERLGRDRLAYPEDDPAVGPRTYQEPVDR